jgi:hypothetical protein
VSKEFTVELAGHSKPYLHVRFGVSCGDIERGIGFAHWGTQEFNGRECEGGWVMSFEDLERIYKAAKATRS